MKENELCDAQVYREGLRGSHYCNQPATKDGLCAHHQPEAVASRVAALESEARTNADRIRAANGWSHNVGRKPDNIIGWGEKLYDPDARHHNRDGFPVFSTRAEARNFAKIKEYKEGRRMRVDPDGGPPTTADRRAEGEAWRARRAKRKERIAKQVGIHEQILKAIGRTK